MSVVPELIDVLVEYNIEYRCLIVDCPEDHRRYLISEFRKILRGYKYCIVFRYIFAEMYSKDYIILLEILERTTTGISGPLLINGKLGFKIKISLEYLRTELYPYLLVINNKPTIVFIKHSLGMTMGHEFRHLFNILIHSNQISNNQRLTMSLMSYSICTTSYLFYENCFHRFFDIIFPELTVYVADAYSSPEHKESELIINEAIDKVKMALEARIPEASRNKDKFKNNWRLAFGDLVEGFQSYFVSYIVDFLRDELNQGFDTFMELACRTTKVIYGAKYVMNMWNHGSRDELGNIAERTVSIGNTEITLSEGIVNQEVIMNYQDEFQAFDKDGNVIEGIIPAIANSEKKLLRIGHAGKDFYCNQNLKGFIFEKEFQETCERYMMLFNEIFGVNEDDLIHCEIST